MIKIYITVKLEIEYFIYCNWPIYISGGHSLPAYKYHCLSYLKKHVFSLYCFFACPHVISITQDSNCTLNKSFRPIKFPIYFVISGIF